MKILLDTHAIIWALTDDPMLSEKARRIISEDDNTVYYSLASLWEIAIKNYKYPEKCPYNEKVIADLCDRSGFFLLDISSTHIQGLRNLKVKSGKELSNYDPFDRLLLSQAKTENMKLVSHDSNFENYEESCIFRI